jgi:hypothetical protein
MEGLLEYRSLRAAWATYGDPISKIKKHGSQRDVEKTATIY